MKQAINKVVGWLKHWTREIIIALVLAIISAIGYEYVIDYLHKKTLHNNLRAVAEVVAYNKDGEPMSQGSGIFISSKGALVTNYHVIKGSNLGQLQAKLTSGAYYRLKDVLGIDEKSDLAILQFDAQETPYVEKIGNSDEVEIGEQIITIGAPLGLASSVSDGVVSNPKRQLEGNDYIQFTAPISSGNSGGGLFSRDGAALGIVTRSINVPPQMQEEVTAQNLNFAVPINVVKNVLKSGGDANTKRFTESSPEYYYSLGILARNAGNNKQAVQHMLKALKLDQKYVDAYIDLGIILADEGLYDEEIMAFKKAVFYDPKNADAHFYLASAYEDKSMHREAIDAYVEALKLRPDDKDVIYQLGLAYLAQGERANARRMIGQLSKRNPGLARQLSMLEEKMK